jgi:hypothetical protein
MVHFTKKKVIFEHKTYKGLPIQMLMSSMLLLCHYQLKLNLKLLGDLPLPAIILLTASRLAKVCSKVSLKMFISLNLFTRDQFQKLMNKHGIIMSSLIQLQLELK